MPLDASGVGYALGFMLATALLHAAGIGLGFVVGLVGQAHGKTVYRAVGGLASLAGVALLVGYL